jgi:predicted O-methyltransferase YrrM
MNARLDPQPGFTEEWFGEEAQKGLASLAASVADVPGLVIEIGSWEGRSTVALANAIWPRSMTAVDTWQGSPGEPSAEIAAGRDIYKQFLQNVAVMTKGNVYPRPLPWRQWILEVTEPLAFVFIDAEHTYTEVRDCIEAVRPHMSPGGIICGDDAHHPPVQRAVIGAFGDASLWASVWWVKL